MYRQWFKNIYPTKANQNTDFTNETNSLNILQHPITTILYLQREGSININKTYHGPLIRHNNTYNTYHHRSQKRMANHKLSQRFTSSQVVHLSQVVHFRPRYVILGTAPMMLFGFVSVSGIVQAQLATVPVIGARRTLGKLRSPRAME